MAQKRKAIKRVYEKGREMTLSAKKRVLTKNQVVSKTKTAKKISPKNIKPRAPIKVGAGQVSDNQHLLNTGVDQYSEKSFFPENDYLPSNYGITRCVLLVRDPYWVYAYWEVEEGHIDKIKRNISESQVATAKFVLRIYDVSLVDFNGINANFFFDIEPNIFTNSWHIKLFHDGGSFVGEIGLRTSDGRFFALSRSNYVQTPRVSYSSRSEQIWMEVTDDDHSAPFVLPKKVNTVLNDKKKSVQNIKSYANPPKRKRLYITEEEIRRYYSRLNPLLKDIIESRLESFYTNKTKKYSVVIEGISEQDRQAMLSRLPKGYFVKEVLLGASENLVVLGEGASEKQISSDSTSSNFVVEKIKSRNFFFELNTELIVYGRTEPDAEVWLADKRVPLRSDGTFSLRFALPDGNIPLEFKAISNDKLDCKRINTYVDRHTNHEQKR